MPIAARRAAVTAVALSAALWLAAAASKSEPPIRFSHRAIPFTLETNETEQRHAPETMAGGVAVFDYDGDGDLDIFFANGADIQTLRKTSPRHANRLFANDGKANFTDVTAKAGLEGSGYDMGVAVGDYDNDGDADLFAGGVHRNTLYHNNGDGTFTDVSTKAGLNKPDPEYGALWSVGGAWVDVNNDGRLDLFVVNYLSWSIETEPACDYQGRREYCHPKVYKKLPNQLYINNGDGTFTDTSAPSGIRAHPGKGMGVAVADYDLDGWMDIFVANDKVYNSLFRNKGNGTFEEVAFTANVALIESGEMISGMGVDFRDADNDGLADIVVVALDDETFPLFKNGGAGEFLDVTRVSNMMSLTLPLAGYSPSIFDIDNDGWKDIFVTCGHVQSLLAAPRIKVAQHNAVFRNLGSGKFGAVPDTGLDARPASRHRGSAIGDLNGDGRVDVVTTAISAPAEVWMNESAAGNHWLALSLEGTRSNRDGIGARIKVTSKSGVQHNHATTSFGYASSSAGPVHFGLGADSVAETVEIRWPSGAVQTLKNVEGGRVVRVKEPAGK